MKIQLDTTNKTIKLEDSVKLSALVKTLEELLPKGLWKDFTLETNTVIEHWGSPFIYKEIIREREPYNPWPQYPWVTYMASSQSFNDNTMLCKSDLSLNSGIYNIEA